MRVKLVLMAFNPEEHQKKISSREPEREDDGRENKTFSSISRNNNVNQLDL